MRWLWTSAVALEISACAEQSGEHNRQGGRNGDRQPSADVRLWLIDALHPTGMFAPESAVSILCPLPKVSRPTVTIHNGRDSTAEIRQP